MLPELFRIPILDLPIHTYGVMIVTGFLLGTYIAYRQSVQIGKYENDVLDFGFWALVGGMIGARVIFILVEWESFFIDKPFTQIGATGIMIPSVLAFWQGGLVFYGGIIGGFFAFVVFAKKRKLPMLHLADILILGVPLGQMFGRLGCVAAGCCYGQSHFHYDSAGQVISNSPLALEFPPGSSAFYSLWESATPQVREFMNQTQHTLPLFPSQLAEAAGTALLFVILFLSARYKRFHGQVILSYAILYSILRSTLEMFRGDADRGFVFGGLLSTSQFISLVIVILSLCTMWWIYRYGQQRVKSNGA